MSAAGSPAVELINITRRFGSVLANDRLSLCTHAGTIHAIIGENGAGKSTAMNILYGVQRQDSGEVRVRGKSVSFSSPREAIAQGIGMVHQHFTLAGPFTALDNIILGAEPGRWGLLDRKGARQRLEALAAEFGLAVDWDCPVEDLEIGLRQRVEILKLLYRRASILILDEPTAVLSPNETRKLFAHLRQLRERGSTIILVSHNLKEVLELSDRVTVLQRGRAIGELATKQATAQQLARMMVGQRAVPDIAGGVRQPGALPALEVAHLNLPRSRARRQPIVDLSLSVYPGEIVGIAGVEGNGQAELIGALLDNPGTESANPTRSKRGEVSGTIHIFGENVAGYGTQRIRALGVGFIPEDRHGQGLVLEVTVADNFLLGLQRRSEFCRQGMIRWPQVKAAAARAVERFRVRSEVSSLAGALSGGNQQKLVIAREFEASPRLLIAAQPTRGVDIAAVDFIHAELLKARDRGAAVLLISSDLDEILALSDRVLVFYRGRVTGGYSRGNVDQRELGLKMGGVA